MIRFCACFIFMLASVVHAETLSASARDSLLAQAEMRLQGGEADRAIVVFEQLVAGEPSNAHLQTRLGYAYLKGKNYKAAEKAFQKAKVLDDSLPGAYVGLGLVYTQSPAVGMASYFAFRKALGEAKRATKLDSTYAPAYRLLGELYERFQADHKRAIEYFLKYVALEPENVDGLYFFGLACVQDGQFQPIDTYLRPYLETHPEETRLMPLVAQGHFYKERFDLALALLEGYIQRLSEKERGYFTDISLVASEKEYQTFLSQTSVEEKQAFLKPFWQRRDPDILTAINERIIEHYRRVWFARTFFAKKGAPWDQRGVVYIRYGEPDYRSSSSSRRFVLSPEAEAVRMRMAVDMYGPESTYMTFSGPVFPIRTMRRVDRPASEVARENPREAVDDVEFDANLDLNPSEQTYQFPELDLESTGSTDLHGNPRSRLQFEAYVPVTMDNEFETVPWETWTYTQLGQGVEFTFTDEVGNGAFDFAPLPPTPLGDKKITSAARMMAYAPGVLFQKTIGVTPDFYRPGLAGDALPFYYDWVDFRGQNGQSVVEVAFGVPPGEVEIANSQLGKLIQVQGTLALADDDHLHVYRHADVFSYQNSQGFNTNKGAFIPDVLRVEAPPGMYQLQVQLKDKVSGRVGIYKQDVRVFSYAGDQLAMSGILLASAIKEKDLNDRFQKGDIAVVPMPSRAYPAGSKVFAYFEIYNLKKDTFGQVRYKVQYRVEYNPKASVGVAGAISSGLKAVFQRQKPQVSVAYDQVGRDPDAHEYVELDLKKARLGVNILEVVIIDENRQVSVSRDVVFLYGQRP